MSDDDRTEPELFGQPPSCGHPLRGHPTTKRIAYVLEWNHPEKANQETHDSEPLASLRDDLASQVPSQIAAPGIKNRGHGNRCDVYGRWRYSRTSASPKQDGD